MFERLKYLYETNKITSSHLEIAVSKSWITEEQKTTIIEATI